jgi:hypothetical protein
VLHLTRKNVFTQEYVAQNKADRDKVLIIEHPFRKDWKLVDSGKPLETTATWYRFRESIPRGKMRSVKVQEEIIQGETIAVLPSDLGQLEFYNRTGEIPQEVRDALVKAISLKSAMLDPDRQVNERQQQLVQITQEQQHMRENMASVSQTSHYYARLLSKLNDQETALGRFQREVST